MKIISQRLLTNTMRCNIITTMVKEAPISGQHLGIWHDIPEGEHGPFQEVQSLASEFLARGTVITRDGRDIQRFRNPPSSDPEFRLTVEKQIYKSPASTRVEIKTASTNFAVEFRPMDTGRNSISIYANNDPNAGQPPEYFIERAADMMGWVEKEEQIKASGETPEFSGLTAISARSEQERILNKVHIPEEVKERYPEFTPELLDNAGLAPAFSMQLSENRIAHFSPIYQGKRQAVVAYIEDGDKVVPRTYYQSDSQAVWRYLPYMTEGFGKGLGEDTLTLPIPIQQSLAVIRNAAPMIIIGDEAFGLITSATAANKDSNYCNYTTRLRPHGNVGKNTLTDRDHGIQLRQYSKGDLSPEDVDFDDQDYYLRPDYRNLVRSWEVNSPVLGPVIVETFESRDGSLEYQFCTTEEGQAWIGGVDVLSGKIRPAGTRDTVMDLGLLTTPAFEYQYQYGYSGGSGIRKGRYEDISEWLHNKIPVIRDYRKSRGLV